MAPGRGRRSIQRSSIQLKLNAASVISRFRFRASLPRPKARWMINSIARVDAVYPSFADRHTAVTKSLRRSVFRDMHLPNASNALSTARLLCLCAPACCRISRSYLFPLSSKITPLSTKVHIDFV